MNVKTFTLTQTKLNKNTNSINKLQIVKIAQLRTTFVILLMLISFFYLIM